MEHADIERILVVGAGAIGGFLAARLAAAGYRVAVVARGAQLAAIRSNGLRLVTAAGPELTVRVDAHPSPDDAQPADAVLVTLKAHQLAELAPALARAAARSTVLVPIHNGIGWWYFQRAGGRHAGRRIETVDPGGVLLATLPLERTVPMYAFKSAEVVAPGVIRHIPAPTDHFPLGELDGAATDRVGRVSAAFERAGMQAPVADIRKTMWAKLLGNVYANPICALTQVPLGPAIAHPATRALAIDLMRECAAVAASLGVEAPMTFEQRLARSAALGDARPSMLQDRDMNRPMELEAILGALVELGELQRIATPCIRSLLACLRLVQDRAAIR